eukprot:gnl/TRDRNA2_/TRDRNA2_194982_c0_seq1.p1 gnl/TRDRNA2_/TRDRNA2_194982_c0~~gnl/TRDRNA2_/TRDRNA2_194982_c0_seq1.p1  ORF type:complete len:347 (-),score=36.16 gnl/TRDRNA2_/TRDRNA2_194982_c0_seq1:134-1174(-)
MAASYGYSPPRGRSYGEGYSPPRGRSPGHGSAASMSPLRARSEEEDDGLYDHPNFMLRSPGPPQWSPGPQPQISVFLPDFGLQVMTRTARCCRPLPRAFVCLGLNLKGLVRLFCFVETLYGILLTVLHMLLLAPPFNEPECDWIPGSGPWLELLDLQWSYRVRGESLHSWEEPMMRYSSHGNFAGTVMGLILGIITLMTVIFFVLYLECYSHYPQYRVMEKVWLIFTTCQVPGFCLCNLGKVSTLCSYASSKHQAAGTKGSYAASAQYVTPAPDSLTFPQVSLHCGTLRMWFIEWTCMVTVLAALGLWACWSYVNLRLQDISTNGGYELTNSSDTADEYPGYPVEF